MFLALYKNIELETLDKYRFTFHGISWGYAMTAALIPLIKGKYLNNNKYNQKKKKKQKKKKERKETKRKQVLPRSRK